MLLRVNREAFANLADADNAEIHQFVVCVL
jgi:hypothetical protein